MPGYGYNEPKWFESLVTEYLYKRKNLLRLFLLIDGEVGLQESDQQAMQNLENLKVPYALVMTKIDKATNSKRLRNLLHLQSVQAKISSLCCFPQAFMLSSHTKEGLQYFMAFIAHISGNLNIEEQ
ncbi:GTP-binding protein 8-like [Uloborus diversus]|uniref:GTP-binding protein 8-like n=1 Tax=Uloborus diversus TaxID=327109 RepID=UPI00240A7BE7|nr:GTP-binding protein 8-like [Uloborus diversus]